MRNPPNDPGALTLEKEPHVPERTCVLTRRKGTKDDLIRLALGPDGSVAPDVRARAPGRGAWIGVTRPELEEANAKGKLKGALQRAFKTNALTVPADIGALTEAVLCPAGAVQHLAGAAVDLPGHEERDQHVGHPRELPLPRHQVVLVAAIGVPRRVGVVLEQVDLAPDPLLAQPLLGAPDQTLEDPLTGLVVDDELGQVVALGRGVLGVAADVEIQPRPVAEEHVGAAAPRHHAAEEIPGDLVRR